MKASLTLSTVSTLLTFFAFGCGSASDLAESPAQLKENAPISCTIQTVNGRYLTAVGGGGRVTDVLHTDATRVGSWERFTLVDSGDGSSPIRYGIKTMNGRYLTAVGGGGRITDVIHSDAPWLRAWEKFQLHSLGGGYYAIKTISGHYVTATGGGGQVNDAIHTDATRVDSWEKFKFTCQSL